MTDSEFKTIFDEVYFSLPNYVLESIRLYSEKGIFVEVLFSDAPVDMAERKFKRGCPSAFLLITDSSWSFAFRPRVADAPQDILTTIIRHEIIHAFLVAAENTHLRNSRIAVQDFERQLRLADPSYKTDSALRKEEKLTSFINKSWGGIEDEARKQGF